MASARARFALIALLSSAAVGGTAWCMVQAMRSPMFNLQVVEVLEESAHSVPLDSQAITDLANVPVGKANLFDLDLGLVESRILSHPWIREVRLQKHFPQTLSILVTYRDPKALLQSEAGKLAYVDADGKVFGQVSLAYQPDLPVLSPSVGGRLPLALRILAAWESSGLQAAAQVSSLSWDGEHGFRAIVSYPLKNDPNAHGRTQVDLGMGTSQGIDEAMELQFLRLARVFAHLSANRMIARQIWADAGKKIVVRMAHGS